MAPRRTLNIGLLLTYNEQDVVAEMLEHNAGGVDAIFALDGSTDATTEVLLAHPKVRLVLRDADVAPGGHVRDHHRQALLDAARAEYGGGHWYTIMHGDEFFHDDPRAVARAAGAMGAGRVNWAAMQFFLHPDDRPALGGSVQENVRWYSPFWVEVRQFRDSPRARYQAGEHGRVFPHGVGWLPYLKMPILKHYPYRSEAQTLARLGAMEARGFSGTKATGGVYRERYAPEYREAHYFGGDFGVFELARQGNLLTMMARWKRLVDKSKAR